MLPTLSPGDRVLVDYRRTPVVGDVVVAWFPGETLVVKRIERPDTLAGQPAWFLVSDNPGAPGATDSHRRGPIRESDVLGVVRLRCWPRPWRV